jgi:hypothetical protein
MTKHVANTTPLSPQQSPQLSLYSAFALSRLDQGHGCGPVVVREDPHGYRWSQPGPPDHGCKG